MDFRRWQVCKERFRDFVNSLSVAVDNNRRCSVRNRNRNRNKKLFDNARNLRRDVRDYSADEDDGILELGTDGGGDNVEV